MRHAGLEFAQNQVDQALDALPCGVAVVERRRGWIRYVNPAMARLLGYERQALLGKPLAELGLCRPDEAERVARDALADPERRNLPLRLQLADGKALDTLATVVGVERDGEPCVQVTLIDVTAWYATERELRVREERLRVIFELSQAGIGTAGRDGRYSFANRRLAEMFGYELDEFIGTRYVDHLHPDAKAVGDEKLRALTEGRIAYVSTERHFVRKDGSDFWGYLTSRRHEDADGQLQALVAVIADITERKQAEAALRASEERYRTLVDLAADSILQGDPQGGIIGANVTASELTGFPPDELLKMNIAQLFAAEEHQRVPLRYDLLKQGQVVRTERWLSRKDGSRLPVEMSSKMMPDGTYQALIRDMSARKTAEDVLRASEEKFARAFDQAPLLMAIASVPDGTLLDVNQQFCTVSGFSREEAIGKTALELGWTTLADVERVRRALAKQGYVRDERRVFHAKDGRTIYGMYRSEQMTIAGQLCVVSTVLDITEKLRLEEELARAQKLESLGVLAGGIAHDFNNLLTGILGNLSLAREPGGDPLESDSALHDCEQAALRAAELTRQLLTFSRGGAPVKRAVATQRLVSEAVGFVLRGANVKGEVDLPRDLWPLDADEGQINQVLSNLLINAKQAMPEGGTAVVSARNEWVEHDQPQLDAGRYVCLAVRDGGQGIAPGTIDRIFDPYFTTKPGGTGLGLTSAYSIVRRHNGTIRVRSEPGRGAEFEVWLPAAQGADGTASALQPVEAGQPGRGGRILIMDDDETIRRVASGIVRKLGYVPVTCNDGAAAVAEYRAARQQGQRFVAVLLDLTVPGGMGGRDAARLIRVDDPAAKLIVSSGYCNDAAVADCGALGFDGAVAKPYTVRMLADELQRVLAAGSPE